jgi:predicted transposase YdaD
LNKNLVKQILRRDIMRESAVYQDILAEGLAEGELKGRAEGEVKGRIEEARALTIRQLTRKFGNVSPNLLAKIESLPLNRVESLGEDLLDFNSIDDLETWLSQN